MRSASSTPTTGASTPRTNGSGSEREPSARTPRGPTTDDAMTRSEEELAVGTTTQERGRARLRKYVVTEQVETTVPVQREEVRVEREPITDANVDDATDGPDISEEEHEVVLDEEQVVVEKQVVPKERVRIVEGHRHRGPAGLRGGPQGADRGRGRSVGSRWPLRLTEVLGLPFASLDASAGGDFTGQKENRWNPNGI